MPTVSVYSEVKQQTDKAMQMGARLSRMQVVIVVVTVVGKRKKECSKLDVIAVSNIIEPPDIHNTWSFLSDY